MGQTLILEHGCAKVERRPWVCVVYDSATCSPDMETASTGHGDDCTEIKLLRDPDAARPAPNDVRTADSRKRAAAGCVHCLYGRPAGRVQRTHHCSHRAAAARARRQAIVRSTVMLLLPTFLWHMYIGNSEYRNTARPQFDLAPAAPHLAHGDVLFLRRELDRDLDRRLPARTMRSAHGHASARTNQNLCPQLDVCVDQNANQRALLVAGRHEHAPPLGTYGRSLLAARTPFRPGRGVRIPPPTSRTR
ncbi:hypothetical protein GCM10020220_013820 [Nonomuraea rubra]